MAITCICGTPAEDELALEAHYELQHPTVEDPGHPEHHAFREWRIVAVGR